MSIAGDIIIGLGCVLLGYALGKERERRQWLKKLRMASRFSTIGTIERDVQ